MNELVILHQETAREHIANAAQLCAAALELGRGLTLEETLAVRRRLTPALGIVDRLKHLARQSFLGFRVKRQVREQL